MTDAQRKLHKLLRKTEKYTHTDMVYLFSGNTWLTIKKILGVVITFGTSIAFANLIPQEVFGKYKYVFSLFGLLAIPTLPGMGQSITRAVSRGFDGTTLHALKTKIKWGFIGSFASLGVALYYYINGNLELTTSFAIVSIFIPFVDTFSIFNTILTGKKLFKVSILYETTVQLIYGIVIISTLFLTDNLFFILTSYLLTYTVARFFVLRRVLQKYTSNQKVDPGAITYGKHLSAMSVLDKITEALDNILLWHFMGAASVAIYAFSKAIPNQIQIFLKNIPTLAFPKFATRDFKDIKKPLIKKMFVFFWMILLIIIAYVLAAPFIFNMFFPQYTEAITYSQIFAVTLLFFPKKIMGTVFGAQAHTKKLYLYTTASSVVKLTLMIILIPIYGIMGAIISEIGLRAFSFGLMTFLFLKTKS